jgi:hypothetical protein
LVTAVALERYKRVSVENGGRGVCTHGSGHQALAVLPDLSRLQGGSDATFIAGRSVWMARGWLAPSEPAHAGSRGGVLSGTYLAEASPTSYSHDVFVEGREGAISWRR